jgi:hypothetical protein
VISQVHGTWGTAKEVPGTAAPNTGGNAQTLSVSCASAGHCSAGGTYKDSSGHTQVFVVSQVNGTWGTAKEVPGTSALNKGGCARGVPDWMVNHRPSRFLTDSPAALPTSVAARSVHGR